MILFAAIITILFILGLRTPIAGIFNKDIVMLLKPFLAFGIVSHHLSGEIKLLDQFHHWGPLVVGIFFFISGYGLTYSLNRKNDYLRNFFYDKILIKLLLPCLLAWCLHMIFNGSHSEYSILDGILNSSGPSLFPNDWFMYVLIYCYLAFMIAGMVRFKAIRLSILILAPVVFVLITGLTGYGRNWWATPIAFSVGVAYASYEPKVRNLVTGKYKYILSTGILTCVLLILMALSYYKNQICIVLTYSLLPLLLVNILIRLDVSKIAQNKIILFLGGISFEVYLIHGIVIEYLRNSYLLSGSELIILTFVFTVIVAYLFKQLMTFSRKGIEYIIPKLTTNGNL